MRAIAGTGPRIYGCDQPPSSDPSIFHRGARPAGLGSDLASTIPLVLAPHSLLPRRWLRRSPSAVDLDLKVIHGVSGIILSQWPSEAKFVTIRVGEMEEPLAPFGIVWRSVWTVAGRDDARMEGVNVGMVEDNTSPPRPISLGRLGDEIEIQ